MDQFFNIAGQLLAGVQTVLAIFALTLLFSLPLGLLVSFGRMSKHFFIRLPVRLYISIMRGTPLMLQLMMIYFGPYYIFRISITGSYRFAAAIIAFVLNYAAYFAEIYRAGIESIPQGQYEAASVLGFSRVKTFFRIILPQVIKRIMPPLTNEAITLVKDTSLAHVISVTEMFLITKSVATAQVSVVPYLVAGVFYYIMNYSVAFGMELIERKLSYYR